MYIKHILFVITHTSILTVHMYPNDITHARLLKPAQDKKESETNTVFSENLNIGQPVIVSFRLNGFDHN